MTTSSVFSAALAGMVERNSAARAVTIVTGPERRIMRFSASSRQQTMGQASSLPHGSETTLLLLDLEAHSHWEVVGDAPLRAPVDRAILVGPVEAPRPAELILHGNVPHGLERVRQHRPALVVEQPRRDDDLIEDKPLALEKVRAELLVVAAGGEVEQERLTRVLRHLGALAGRVQVLDHALVFGGVVEVAADEQVDVGVGHEHRLEAPVDEVRVLRPPAALFLFVAAA